MEALPRASPVDRYTRMMAIDQQSGQQRTKRDIIVNELRSLIATGAIFPG